MWMLSILGTATAEPSRLSPIFINTWPCSMCGQGGHVANGLCARDKYDGCKPLRSGIYSCVNAWGVQKVQSCHATHAANQFHDPIFPHLEIATAGWPADKIFASHPYGSEPQHVTMYRVAEADKVGTFGRHSFTMFHIIPFLSSRYWKLLVTQELEIYTPKGALCLAWHQPWVHRPKGFHRMPILCGICPQTWNHRCLGMDKPINKSGVDCDNLWTLEVPGISSLISQTLLMSCWRSVLTRLEAALQNPFSFLGNCLLLWCFLDYLLSWYPGLQEAKSVKNLIVSFSLAIGPMKAYQFFWYQ